MNAFLHRLRSSADRAWLPVLPAPPRLRGVLLHPPRLALPFLRRRDRLRARLPDNPSRVPWYLRARIWRPSWGSPGQPRQVCLGLPRQAVRSVLVFLGRKALPRRDNRSTVDPCARDSLWLPGKARVRVRVSGRVHPCAPADLARCIRPRAVPVWSPLSRRRRPISSAAPEVTADVRNSEIGARSPKRRFCGLPPAVRQLPGRRRSAVRLPSRKASR